MRLKSAFILVLVSLIGSFVIACNSGSNNSGGGGNNGGGNNGGADGGGSGGGDSGGGEGDIVTGNTFNFGYIAYTVDLKENHIIHQDELRGRDHNLVITNNTDASVEYSYEITGTDKDFFEPVFVPLLQEGQNVVDPNSCIQDKISRPVGKIKVLKRGESCNFLVTPRSVQGNDTKDDIDGKKSATLKILNDDKIVLEKKLESEYIWSANIDDMNIDNIYFHPSDIGVKSPSYFLFETNINQSRVEEMKTQGYELESATVEYTGDTAFQLDTEKTECGIKLANSKLPIEEYFCVVVFTFTPPDSNPKFGTFTEKIKYVNSSNGSEKGDTTTYTLNGEGLNQVN